MDNNNTTNSLLDSRHILDQEWKRIFVFVLISIFCCGLIGNALVLVVMCNRRFEKSSTSIYLIVLAISDNSVLFLGPITGVMLMSGVFPKFDIRMTRILVCYVFKFFLYWARQLSSFCLMSITLERLIVILKPHRYVTV